MFLKITLVTIIGGLMVAADYLFNCFYARDRKIPRGKTCHDHTPSSYRPFYYLKGAKEKQTLKGLLMQPFYLSPLACLGYGSRWNNLYPPDRQHLRRTCNGSGKAIQDGARYASLGAAGLDFMMGHPAMILTWGLSFLKIRRPGNPGLFCGDGTG